MDLKNEDLLMFFKPYELAIMKFLMQNNQGLNSREVWEGIDMRRSRASVINFLESITVEGLLDKHEVTGKGGHRGI